MFGPGARVKPIMGTDHEEESQLRYEKRYGHRRGTVVKACLLSYHPDLFWRVKWDGNKNDAVCSQYSLALVND